MAVLRFLVLTVTCLAIASPAIAQWVPNGRMLSAASGVSSTASVVADGTGGAYVVWQEYSGSYPEALYVSRLLSNGATAPGFPSGGLAVSLSGTPRHLGADADGAGGVVIAWGVWASNIARLKRFQADGSPVAGWPASGNAYTLPASTQAWTGDGQGGGWFRYRIESSFCPHSCTYASDAYARHVDAAGVLNDGSFHIGGSSFASGAQASMAGIGPGSGLVSGSNETLTGRVARVDAAHQLVWNFSLDTEHVIVLAAIGDGSGGALVMTEGPFGSLPPRMLRIATDGTAYPGWPAGGAVIREPEGALTGFTAVGSGDGSAVVGWTEYDPAGTKVKLQKITASGALAPGWPANGLVVCDAPEHRDQLVLATDGAGGAILAWRDQRSEGDLYAAHATAGGTLDPTYSTNGTAIAAVPGGVHGLILTPVGGGEAILAWSDSRTGSPGVYAQKLPLPGSAGVGNGSGRLALAGFVPNPAPALPRVAFTLARAGDATLELFDLVGRRVHEARWSGLSAGPHQLALTPLHPLAPGLYLLRLRANGEQSVRRGLVSH